MLVADVTRRWLSEHVCELVAGDRYAASVLTLERFYFHQRKLRKMPDPFTLASVRSARSLPGDLAPYYASWSDAA